VARAAAARGGDTAHRDAPCAAPGADVLDPDADHVHRGRGAGLLSEIGKVLLAERVDVVMARIMTIGERAEDVFYVTDDRGQPLGEEARLRLQDKLTESLDRREAAKIA
jgi:hypothetical protein